MAFKQNKMASMKHISITEAAKKLREEYPYYQAWSIGIGGNRLYVYCNAVPYYARKYFLGYKVVYRLCDPPVAGYNEGLDL
jgi:hypothetical protein